MDCMSNEEKNLYKELFNMVYEWGRVGIITDENSTAFQEKIKEIVDEAIFDYRRHGTT